MMNAQVWKGSRFSVEREEDGRAGTVMFRLAGPFTSRDMYGSLSPDALRDIFTVKRTGEQSAVHILDLSGVPYMDSAGLGVIATHYTRCRAEGIQLMAVGVCARVFEQFEITRMNRFIPVSGRNKEADPQIRQERSI